MNFEKSKTSDFWKKWKKLLEISSFYTCVPKTQSYEVQFLRYRVRENFLSFWAIFCSFAPLLTPKIKIWKKCEKHPDIYPILLYMCTINQDHMMYGFWDMKCNRQNFLSSWTVFCPFTPHLPFAHLTAGQMKISKMKKKKPWRYHYFTQVYQNSWS